MFDGNGNWISDFSAQADRDNGIKILASRFDNIFIADIKESFENCLTKDGQIAPIGAFNMGGQKITNLGTGTNGTDGVNVNQVNQALTTLFDVGDIKTSVRSANHGNWFICNGQAIDRQVYSELYDIIGTNFGAGDGVTTFNLPDYRGKFLRGLGGNSAADIYTTQAEGLPEISGSFYLTGASGSHGTFSGAFYEEKSSNGYGHGSAGDSTNPIVGFKASRSSEIYGASNHVTPINQAVNYFIKVL